MSTTIGLLPAGQSSLPIVGLSARASGSRLPVPEAPSQHCRCAPTAVCAVPLIGTIAPVGCSKCPVGEGLIAIGRDIGPRTTSRLVNALDDRGNTHAAPDAQRDQTVLQRSSFEFVDQGAD
jgi:hypothetical protein